MRDAGLVFNAPGRTAPTRAVPFSPRHEAALAYFSHSQSPEQPGEPGHQCNAAAPHAKRGGSLERHLLCGVSQWSSAPSTPVTTRLLAYHGIPVAKATLVILSHAAWQCDVVMTAKVAIRRCACCLLPYNNEATRTTSCDGARPHREGGQRVSFLLKATDAAFKRSPAGWPGMHAWPESVTARARVPWGQGRRHRWNERTKHGSESANCVQRR